jgi:hypothetical protein
MTTLTSVERDLEEHNLVALADVGYTGSDHIWVINDLPASSRLRARHAGLRSVVEQMFSRVRLWAAANVKFKQCPELQEMALLVIYSLVQLKNRSSAPRPSQTAFPADS